MKNRKFIRTLIAVVAILFLLVSTSSCQKTGNRTLYLQETTAAKGCTTTTSKTKFDWLVEKIENNVETSVATYLAWVHTNDPDKEEAETARKEQIKIYGVSYNNGTEDVVTASYISNAKELIGKYAVKNVIAGKNDEEQINAHYLVAQINILMEEYYGYIENVKTSETATANVDMINELKSGINGSAGCFDIKVESLVHASIKKAGEETDVYRITALYVLAVDTTLTNLEPIVFKGASVGDFFGHLWNNLFIFPVAWLLVNISKLCGGIYVIGLIIATILIRTLGWPIYAKSNDMSSKMSELQPELQKIQDKYAGRDDPDSKRMMQMEQAQLYKKNKVGFGGCLLPILQLPIFMAVFRAISRIPYTKAIPGTIYNLDWANELNPRVFGINLFEGRNIGGVGQLIGVIVLALLVVGTQILSQLILQHRQKVSKEKSQEDIPAYRRQAYNQTQNQSQNSMKIMMWMMVVMMGFFVWSSKAGLGVYWLIGNLYSMGQSFINSKTQEKRKEKQKEEEMKNRGIYTINRDKPKKEKKNKK